MKRREWKAVKRATGWAVFDPDQKFHGTFKTPEAAQAYIEMKTEGRQRRAHVAAQVAMIVVVLLALFVPWPAQAGGSGITPPLVRCRIVRTVKVCTVVRPVVARHP